MIITKIRLGHKNKIAYVMREKGMPEHHTMLCEESYRPEFRDAMMKVSEQFQLISPIKDSTARIGICDITIKYDESWIAKSYDLKGVICGNEMSHMSFDKNEIMTDASKELTHAIRIACEEAVQYVKGNRAQGNLFEQEQNNEDTLPAAVS